MDDQLNETLTALRDQLEQLTARISSLETVVDRQAAQLAEAAPSRNAAAASASRAEQKATEAAPSPAETVTPETLMVISAAIAAYLGVKPRIRQVRLIGSPSWVQQGRVTIQASHALAVRAPRE
jgi:methylmalonyl-CoA carboxyltransferase large subunit